MMIPFSNSIFNIGDKVSRNVLVSTDHGLMIVNRFDSNHECVGHSQWLLDHGNCNTLEVNDCYQAIKDVTNPIVFDVGANIGTISIWLSKILHLHHKIVPFCSIPTITNVFIRVFQRLT